MRCFEVLTQMLVTSAHSPHSQTSPSRSISPGSRSCRKPVSLLPGSPPSSSPRATRPARSWKRRMETVFLMVVSIVVVYIFKCSSYSYMDVRTVYHEEEWLPAISVTSKRRRRVNNHVSQHQHHRRNKKAPVTKAKKKVESVKTKRKELLVHPQVLFYTGQSFKATKGRRIRSRYDLSLRKRKQSDRPSWSLPTNTTYCVPKQPWQTTSFPTCNTMHEISLLNRREDEARLLGTGGWRATFQVSNNRGENVAFKTLK